MCDISRDTHLSCMQDGHATKFPLEADALIFGTLCFVSMGALSSMMWCGGVHTVGISVI